MVGVGAMIGAGIFVLTGIAAGPAGPALILAFALNGVVTFLTAMVYAELGSAIPEAGGGYLWIKQGLPAWNGLVMVPALAASPAACEAPMPNAISVFWTSSSSR